MALSPFLTDTRLKTEARDLIQQVQKQWEFNMPMLAQDGKKKNSEQTRHGRKCLTLMLGPTPNLQQRTSC